MNRMPLVYLPGLDGTGRLLHRQPDLFDRYQVSCITYPHEGANTYNELAELAVPYLETHGPGIVLAESFGGAVALTLALARPDLVQRLVLVNTFAYFPRRWLMHLLAFLGQFLPAKPSSPATRKVRGLFFFAPEISESERNEWWDRTSHVPMSAFGNRFRLIADLDLRPRLTTIQIPSLVLVASNDGVVPPGAGLDLARRLPNARLIRVRAGHAALIHPRVSIAHLLEVGP